MKDLKPAAQIIAVVPRVMHRLRQEFRNVARGQLSVPQFRVLVRLEESPATPKEVAEWMDVAAPTLSRMTTVLVQKKLIQQISDSSDRRRISLSLTRLGHDRLDQFRLAVRKQIEIHVSSLSPSEHKKLSDGLTLLEKLFPQRGPCEN